MTKNNSDKMSIHSSKEPRIQAPQNFSEQEVDLDKTPLFFPEGFEKLFLAIYIVIFPYIVGLIFLFVYIAEGKPELFLSLNEESSFLLTWTIGYEIMAASILLYIVKMSLSFVNNNQNSNLKPFRRP